MLDVIPGVRKQGLTEVLLIGGFSRIGNELVIGGINVRELTEAYGTPLYVYDAGLLRRNYRKLCNAVSGFAEIYYSIKANPNPAIANIFVREGAGIETASGGEIITASDAGCPPERVLLAGPAKGKQEIALAIATGVGELHLESFEEIELVARIASDIGKTVPVAIRVNPLASAQGGALRMGGKAAPFGFDEETLEDVLGEILRHPELFVTGVHMYSGTQILDADVLLNQWRHALNIASSLAEILERPLRTVDLGGGLGVPYHAGDSELDLNALARGVPELIEEVKTNPLLRDAKIILEPGRYLTASAGIYLTKVRAVKQSRDTRFVITDGGMHHNLAASGNLGQVIKRDYPIVCATRVNDHEKTPAVITGPLCTPLDTLGRQTKLPRIYKDDIIAVLQSGAYGLMASPNGFLSHPMPAEVLIENGKARLIRPAGTFQTLTTSPI